MVLHLFSVKADIYVANTIISSLALAEMKTLLRDVYSKYSTVPDASMTQESMVMSDQLISARPLGQKCLLHFHPLAESKA